MTQLMKGKKGIIMGVTNSFSIAWSVAEILSEHGAQIAFSAPNDKIKSKIEPLATKVNSNLILNCDVSKEEEIVNTFKTLEKEWGEIDFLVHAIGFSDKNELNGLYLNTSLDNFLNTMHISCFSYTQIMKYAAPLMKNGGSSLTLTYMGSQRVMPNYNVMGVAKAALESSVKYLAVDLGKSNIRVNSVSAGPIKTMAASGISDFSYILKWNEQNSPLRRNVSQKEVGNSCLYLLSDLSSAVTGETHYVDCGYNIVGMKAVDAEDLTK